MANQHTTSALSGLQRRSRISSAELRLLWETRKKIAVSARGCWEWQGRRDRYGYGRICHHRRSHLTHRLVYLLCVADIPTGMEVCHNCPDGDNPACCNPAHLFLGTHTDNMRDAAKKGRLKPRDSRGEKNPAAKLTPAKVRAIRRRADQLGRPRGVSQLLAPEFGVHAATIGRVLSGAIWGHVA